MLPYYPYTDGTAESSPYRVESFWWHLTAEYTGMSFAEIRQISYIDYLRWRRDAFIATLERTEKGRDYLKNAYRMEQTEPDRERLRKKLHRG